MPKHPNVTFDDFDRQRALYWQMNQIGLSSEDVRKIVGGRLFHLWQTTPGRTLCGLDGDPHSHLWYGEPVCGQCHATLLMLAKQKETAA